MNDILYELCRHCVSMMDGWMPYPSTVLADCCSKTLYQTRKELKRLKALGLVISDRYIDKDPEWDRPIIINGYTITDQAKSTQEYKAAFDKERAICMEAFGVDISSRDRFVLD